MGEQRGIRNTVYNGIVAKPLTKENCDYWFECVRKYLIGKDVWEVVDGTFAKPPENGEKKEIVRWRIKNGIALHAILISCGIQAFSHIRRVSEAKDAWNILTHTYNYNPQTKPEPQEPPDIEPSPLDQSNASPVDPSSSNPSTMRGEEAANYDVSAVYKAIRGNNWNAAKALLEEHPTAITAKLTILGQTPLHVAASLGHVSMVEELVALSTTTPQLLETVDVHGNTPLATAALYGAHPRIAECMVNKNNNLVAITNREGTLPVTIAVLNGHKRMARCLYSLTPLEVFKRDNGGIQAIKLLRRCFNIGELGIALDLLLKCQELILAKDDIKQIPILKIAAMPSAFSKGRDLVFWKRWIYNCHSLLSRLISKTYNMLGMKEIYEMKLVHAQAAQILSLLCEKVNFLGSNMREERNEVIIGLIRAAEEGNVEFLVKVLKEDPQLALLVTSKIFNIFFVAVKYRQAEVFNLIHGLTSKDVIASRIDKNGNTMLHMVADPAPPFKLNRISGPAFQMQYELQWFKEVESVIPQGYRAYENQGGMQPKDVFKMSHKGLREEGEKWMKETANSCSVVGALVVTIMFAAAFTVPGGNNQDYGYPIFLKEKLFMLFAVSDVLSLFSSTTSVLIFLGILTSRYAEEDFLKSLPTKLIIGLSTLFLSIATMIIAFSATILLMMQHRSHSWVYLPIIMLASVPITLFVLLQFPLLVRMISSTYGPGIFKRNVQPWL
ncbi:ankyrin repeat-containing protein NPR4-like isoform X1 [Senna tora]|uniref:Ankyrin repeat-containing protein NPR4-like isoform X1 n=1 Tax=Senna tora TaxID=362788 RepID=A0A834TGB5_9FABA|nr:ankyrin repeat-containing protein NPR4-like isoform X1 [Senna tora]